MAAQPDPTASVADTVAAVRVWVRAHEPELAPFREHPTGDLAEGIAATQPLRKLLFDAGWTRLGWPEECGGIGGSAVQRAAALDAFAAAGYAIPEVHGTVEIVAPMLIRFAPQLAAAHVPAGLSGDEVWC